MKINRTYSLDNEICEELEKIDNASKLINDLLKDYFYKNGRLKKQELIIKLGKKQTEQDNIISEITKIKEMIKIAENKEQKLKSVPEEILQDFEAFPKIDKIILRKRYIEIYKSKYDIDWGEVLTAWEEWKKE